MSGVVNVINPRQFPWEETKQHGVRVHLVGCLQAETAIIEAACKGTLDSLSALLRREPETFGIIVDTDTHIVAATDRIRGYPIYVRTKGDNVEVAVNTSHWITPDLADEFNEDRVGHFLATGYTIGSDTLFSSIRRLLSGEIVLLDKATGRTDYRRYFTYRPAFNENHESERYWEDRLEASLDGAISRVISRADGARIWVPLSAGYDSRVVLAKLLALGYDRVETFSYGVPGNMEARVACEIAEKAGVPWRFVPSLPHQPRKAFFSEEITRYFLFSGGGGTVPAMSEFFALKQLKKSKALADGDYIINGQTGDFLTGGHIPQVKTFASLSEYCLNKHFALFNQEKRKIGQDGIENLLHNWIERYLPKQEVMGNSSDQLLSLYQTFEWQERQSQYVVQQQRAYDFLGILWALPLWDADLMNLFETVPLKEQQQQALYIRYLQKWNFKDLFAEHRRPYDPWPRYGLAYRTLARFVGLVAGGEAKANAYRHLGYWGDLHFQWAYFGQKTFRAFINEIRNPPSLFTLDYLTRLRHTIGLLPRHPLEKKYAALRPSILD